LESTYALIADVVMSSGSDGRLNTGHAKLFHPRSRVSLSLSCLHLFSWFSYSLMSSSRESTFVLLACRSLSSRSCSRLNCSCCCLARSSARRAHSASSNLAAYGDVPGAPGLALVGDGLGVDERGMDDDENEEFAVCELLIEAGRLDHVELAEELKVEVDDALLRSPAEPVVEPDRCESNDAPMLFWRSRSNVRW